MQFARPQIRDFSMHLVINNQPVDWNDRDLKYVSNLDENGRTALRFIKSWNENERVFHFSSSGSTGNPKLMQFERNQLQQSAERTIRFLGLRQKPQHFFCCLNTSFTAGAMMLARAMILKADLSIVTPSSNPVSAIDLWHPFTFASFVPVQLKIALQEDEKELMSKLERFDNILVGGGPLDRELEQKLAPVRTNLWHTYGMTETLTHIALRKIGTDDYFSPLPGIELNADNDDCLWVKADVTHDEWLRTKDIVQFERNKFRILGRKDFVINSGGMKINPELLEADLMQLLTTAGIPFEDLFVASKPDEIWGEKVVLYVKGTASVSSFLQKMEEVFHEHLPAFKRPCEVFFRTDFCYTITGKIDREKSKRNK